MGGLGIAFKTAGPTAPDTISICEGKFAVAHSADDAFCALVLIDDRGPKILRNTFTMVQYESIKVVPK